MANPTWQELKMMPTLNPRPKCLSQNMIWLGFKLHGLRFNTMPKHIDFYLMFLFLWPRVTSH